MYDIPSSLRCNMLLSGAHHSVALFKHWRSERAVSRWESNNNNQKSKQKSRHSKSSSVSFLLPPAIKVNLSSPWGVHQKRVQHQRTSIPSNVAISFMTISLVNSMELFFRQRTRFRNLSRLSSVMCGMDSSCMFMCCSSKYKVDRTERGNGFKNTKTRRTSLAAIYKHPGSFSQHFFSPFSAFTFRRWIGSEKLTTWATRLAE